jgi:hypothetical protein
MIPLLDMLNHKTEAHQVTWKPCVPESNVNVEDSPGPASHPPQAIVHKRVRKGSEVYCCYGLLSNQDLILRYGFAQMNNPSDEIKIGWTLLDAAGLFFSGIAGYQLFECRQFQRVHSCANNWPGASINNRQTKKPRYQYITKEFYAITLLLHLPQAQKVCVSHLAHLTTLHCSILDTTI